MIAQRMSRGAGGFTLTELLVAMAVLILVVAFVSQLMNSTTMSTNMSKNHGDADTQARLVFDRMAADFAGMPRRTDIDFVFSKQAGNDKMYFYSMAPSFYDATKFSGTSALLKDSTALVGYSIYPGGASTNFSAYSLLRLSKGLTWSSSQPANGPGGMMFLTIPSPGSLPILGSTNGLAFTQSSAIGTSPSYDASGSSDYTTYNDTLSSEVLRFEYCFQVKDLTRPNAPSSAYSQYPVANFGNGASNTTTIGSQPTKPTAGDRWYDTQANRAYVCTGYVATSTGSSAVWTPNGLSDVTAIVAGIAVLDSNNRKIAANHLADISNALADPTDAQLRPGSGTNPQLMADIWGAALEQSNFASSVSVPNIAAAQIRVYQRFFYLNNL
jgi:prepilin-type N-terminal cleavage/methylation domain-containing protein